MAFRITYTHRAAGQLRKVDRPIARRIVDGIEKLAASPRPHGHIRLQGHRDLYLIRVGDYRVVYRIDDAVELVEITIVAHRRDVYRGL